MFTLPRLTINLNTVLENYKSFQNHSAPGTTVSAVVKNDAYGLGTKAVADVLYRIGGCRNFFVAHALEGQIVRQVAPDSNIYVLQGIGKDSLESLKTNNLIPVISSWEQFEFWKQHKPNNKKPALQIETGLNRLGLSDAELNKLPDSEKDCFGLVISHLSCADMPVHPLNKNQKNEFCRLKTLFPNARFSLSATDGFFLGDDYHFDMVRIGAGLYGLNPNPQALFKSKNPIHLSAPVLQIKTIKKGDSVGYASAFIAQQSMRIATISIGYGDGILRSFSSQGKVWIKGKAAPVIGRVSMDNIICDISEFGPDDVKAGDFADIINDIYPPDEFGTDCGTIGYEIIGTICQGKRALKTYLSDF